MMLMTDTTGSSTLPRAIIRSQLEGARRDLLDISGRNPLLNYRIHAKGKNGTTKPLARRIEVVDELPMEVYRLLITDGRGMAFLPKSGSENAEAETDDLELLPAVDYDPAEVAKRQTDLYLQTKLTDQRLDAQLLEIYRTARTLQEEQGVNNLFLALGLLQWFEADSSEEARLAPLLLVPVELERTSVRSRFRVTYSGEEIAYNRSLGAKLSEFGVTLPVLPESDDLDVSAYFEAVRTSIGSQRRWRVEAQAIHLSFFSFTKFLMHRDLDPAMWPADKQPEAHPILEALLGDGFGYEPSEFGEDDRLDDRLTPVNLHHVLDADSSQTVVIHDITTGRNLVVEGPPGTGKSQTITNVIAESIAGGKRVLFVAEKMAALDVVKRRLDQVGLGDACLELHSHKTNKKAVIAELKHTLELGQPRQTVAHAKLEELTEVRDRLNTYAQAVNTPMSTSEITPYWAFGELQALQEQFGDSVLVFDQAALVLWNLRDLERKQKLVSNLTDWLREHGQPIQHPFWGSRKTVYTPLEERGIRVSLTSALDATSRLQTSAQTLAQMYGLPVPSNHLEASQLAAVVSRAMSAPPLDGIALENDDWAGPPDRLEALFERGLGLQHLHQRFDQRLDQNAWGQDVTAEYEALKVHGQKLLRFLIGPYRKAQDKLRSVYQGQPERELEKQIEALKAILKDRELSAAFEEGVAYGAMLFGGQWQGRSSKFDHLRKTSSWVRQMHEDVRHGVLPDWAARFISSAPKVEAQLQLKELETALAAFALALEGSRGVFDLDESVRFGPGVRLVERPLAEVEVLLTQWSARVPELLDITLYTLLTDELKREGLAETQAAALKDLALAANLSLLLHRAWLEAHLGRAYIERPVLAQFDRTTQDNLIRQYRELDRTSYEINRQRVALAHWQRLPNPQAIANTGQIAILKRQFELKTRHMPIRKLLKSAGNVVQALKPVFMMSPLSVANFLEPGGLEFDLVIFDEASQVRPADALGAILRGRQVVVVGDSKQLPPTNFFERTVSGDEADDENDDSATADIPSILGLFKSKSVPDRMLRWHYRSRHESLIAASNRLFYDNKLVIFPSPGSGIERVGLSFHHLTETVYDRGGSRSNVEEAKAVARAVLEHTRTQEGSTLGVVAFSMAQQRAIEDQIELIRREHPELEHFFRSNANEPFFVKNLENVQGDERDVIFISVGYGRDRDGKLTMNFGPVNSKGGEKRLNVLFTRARVRCEVFSNFTADDLNTTSDTPVGVKALKTYLHQAKTGQIELPIETAREPDSPFEISVRDALIARGYAIKTQIGVAGYFVDLAVVDPKQPGRYILGIECDGATYHSARSARDRDRLRQAILENLGWRIHRIWSTDYFRHPARELDRVVEAIERAKLVAPPEVSKPQNTPIEATINRDSEQITPDQQNRLTIAPYQPTNLTVSYHGELHLVPVPQLAQWLEVVVGFEGPVHVEEAVRRVMDAAQVQRVGNRIRDAMTTAISFSLRAGRFDQRGSFLWPKGMTEPPIRDRSTLPQTSRKLDFVSDEEIAAVVMQVASESFGFASDDIASTVVRILGFGRVTESVQDRIAKVVQALVFSGKLSVKNDLLVVQRSG